ncbi:molybdenum cofactor guanylyltransferase [Tsukamurella sp. PLM1]|uniref:molybdenum cofactor guanylyltransferase n=1 Tax=Tsukamurella sp. PLM1 TaxID=2929795 RepID=UPI00205106EA|nr:NTP transferase domain-containing protein [Tsukamurella sp. PLM1]BDH56626.1 molybdenum cofactor guanylyltransferase [Tsukamurella sp. PLM1]
MTSTDDDAPAASFDAAIIVAGGRSRRLGLDKPEQVVGGVRLLDVALHAVDGARTIVVGPPRAVPPGVRVVREDPPGTGPLAAIAAGIASLPDDVRVVAVLASDLPEIDRGTVEALAGLRARTGAPVALAEDLAGRAQYLLAVWDAAALRSALAAAGDPAGRPIRVVVPADAPRLRVDTGDVDTPEDLRRARTRHAHRR